MNIFMPFPKPQTTAIFLSRPQRFLAEMQMPDGTRTLAYCANPGSFHGCLRPGCKALIWDSQDAKRKRRYTWRAIRLAGRWIGTDTHLANGIAEKILKQNLVDSLDGMQIQQREATVGTGVRIDFVMNGKKGPCYVEVKSATIAEKGVARFPDSITPRALKHLRWLSERAAAGERAVLLFVIQRSDVVTFKATHAYYPEYLEALRDGQRVGVEVVAFCLKVSVAGFGPPRRIPVLLE